MQIEWEQGARKRMKKGKEAALHRCRFVDWRPSPVSCLALSPDSFDCASLDVGCTERELLAVGRADGDVELMAWGGHQGWVHCRTLPCPFAHDPSIQPSQKRPFSMVTHLAWSHQTTLSESDLALFEGDRAGAERELARLKRQSLRLFGVGGHNRELVEWEWGAPGSSARFGQVKAVLPSLPPILSLAVSPSGAHLAVGCEDSAIRIVSLLDGDFDVVAKIEVGSAAKVRPTSLVFAQPHHHTSPRAAEEPVSALTSEASTSRGASVEASSLPANFATPQETYLVAGCSDSTIRRFDAPTEAGTPWTQTHRMTVDRLKGEHTVVWAVGIAADSTIVSADSMGNVKFWDARMGTQLHTYKAHRSDVLTLAVGSNGRNVFTSGVDQKVVEFRYVQSTKQGATTWRWVESSGRRIHSHDVQAMVVSPPYSPDATSIATPVLTSGGFDLGLVLVCAANTVHPPNSARPYKNVISDVPSTLFDTTIHRKAAYTPQRPTVHLASRARLLACRRARSVSIWRVGKSSGSSKDSSEPTSNAFGGTDSGSNNAFFEDDWTKMLDIELKLQTNLIASAISADGAWLAVSDLFETKLFRLSQKNGELHAKRVRDFSSSLSLAMSDSFGTGSGCLEFVGSDQLVLATAFGSTVVIVELPPTKDASCTVKATFDARSKVPIKHLPSMRNGRVPDNDSDSDSDSDTDDEMVDAVDVDEAEEATSVTCMTVSSDSKWLALATLRRKVVIYDLARLALHAVLPRTRTPPTALAFATSHWLVSAFPDNSLEVFDLETLRAPDWSLPLGDKHANRLMDYREPIVGLVPRVKGPSIVSIDAWAANWIAKIDLTALSSPASGGPLANQPDQQQQQRQKKKRRRHSATQKAQDAALDAVELPVHVNRRYAPLLLFDYMAGGSSSKKDEAVVVERVWQDVVRDLPPAFARFGEFGA